MSIVELPIHIDNPGLQIALYDRIQVWRSATQLGTYADISADSPVAAALDGSVSAPWALSGETLTIAWNGALPVNITFMGSNPLGLIDVLAQISQVEMPGTVREVPTDTNRLRLTSIIAGTQSSIVVSGSAATTLGLSTSKVNGFGPRPLLSSKTEDYTFRDYDGPLGAWYKTRLYSSVTFVVSTFTDPVAAGPGAALTGSLVVTGKIALAAPDGSPVANRRIIVVPVGSQIVADGSGHNYGVLPSVDRVTVVTDANGQASMLFVKGQRVKVFLEGTTFQREFVVPTTDFDILTVASAQPDPLSIVVSPPFPIRMS